jgi:hypothetical protein
MKTIRILLGMTTIAAAVFLAACGGDDDDPVKAGPLTLTSVTAVGTDIDTGDPLTRTLAAGAATSNVPVNSEFTVVFSKDVDAATATSTNFAITTGGVAVPATVTSDGDEVTITPTADLATDTDYTLTLTSAIKGDDGGIFTQATRAFTTQAEGEEPLEEGLLAHYKFEDDATDESGDFDATVITAITYAASRNTAAGKAASFNGTTSIIEVPNGDQLMTHDDLTVSFWVKADGTKNGHFVLGLAGWYGFQFEIGGEVWDAVNKSVKLAARYELANGEFTGEDTWWNGQANGWQGSEVGLDVSAEVPPGVGKYFKDVWAHVACTYDASEKKGAMYVNGIKTRQWDFDLWPDGDAKKTVVGVVYDGNTTEGGNNLAIGFIQASGNRKIVDDWANPAIEANNHFKGLLDDIRIYGKALTEAEVQAHYNNEKP